MRNPWKGGDKAALWTTGWTPAFPGEVVYIRADTGDPHEVRLVAPRTRARASMQTVFPFRESERDGTRRRCRRGAEARPTTR